MKMSIIGCSDDVIIISHDSFLKKLYKNVNFNGENVSFCFKSCYFNITEPYKQKKLKKSRIEEELDKEAVMVRGIHDQNMDLIKDLLKIGGNFEVLDRDEDSGKFDLGAGFNGGNLTDDCLVAAVNNENYLVPPRCRFFNYDVKDISEHVDGKFDVIILDPPWWNKYIRRKRARNAEDGYNMMWNEELAEIPINSLLEANGLVAVWCTNSKSHIDAIKKIIFPKWGIEFISQWFWLKVTQTGDPVTPYSPTNRKQPYERILFGCKKPRNLPIPEEGKLIISVPSALHSHKPPITEILRPFLGNNPKGLEIFARYLLPDFTSYGNQVLKLQHVSLFTLSR